MAPRRARAVQQFINGERGSRMSLRLIDAGVVPLDEAARRFGVDVARGLAAQGKWLDRRWRRDDAGATMLDVLCELPEYDVCRAERAILAANAGGIAALTAPGTTLIEIGNGSGGAGTTPILVAAL